MKKLAYLFVFILIGACSRQNQLEHVPTYIVSIGQVMPNVFLGRPTQMVYADSALLIADNMVETLLNIYDLKCNAHASQSLKSGNAMQEEQKSKTGRSILKFDMQGNLVCKYEHDFPIISLCFGENNDVYAISQSKELDYTIIKFRLE